MPSHPARAGWWMWQGLTPDQLGTVDFETKLWVTNCANSDMRLGGAPKNCVLCKISRLCGPEGGQVSAAGACRPGPGGCNCAGCAHRNKMINTQYESLGTRAGDVWS